MSRGKFIITGLVLATIVSSFIFLQIKSKLTVIPHTTTPTTDKFGIPEDPSIVIEKGKVVERKKIEPTIPGWQTYQNPSKGFVFWYPPQWVIAEYKKLDDGSLEKYIPTTGVTLD
jgi:hypothetical protein